MSGITNKARRYAVRALAVSALVATVSCSAVIRNHGYVPSDADLAALTVGLDTRDSVIASVGPPTSGGVLEGGNFYYVASKFRHFGAYAPEEIERQVLAISFGADGTVTNIERFGLQDGRVVALSRRVTDDGISDTTFIRQLLGSFGRIDAGTFLGES